MSRRRRQTKPAAAVTEQPRHAAPASTAEPGDRLWLAAFLLLSFLIGVVEIEDPDIWWHLRTGQLIAERQEIPRADWFTYTNPDSPWIDLHWTFQLFVAALWAVGGAAALVLTKSLFALGVFAIAVSVRGAGSSGRQTVACWIPSLLIFSGRNEVRPEMFTFLYLALTTAIVFQARRRPRLTWWLPLIQCLWVNVHGLFVLGLIVWGCFLVDGAFRLSRLAGQHGERPSGADLRQWAAVSGCMALATLLNPYGYRGASFPLVLFQRIEGEQRAFYAQFAGEFAGLNEFIANYGFLATLTNVTILMIWVLLALAAVSFWRLWRRRRFGMLRVLLFAAFAYLAWRSSRNSALLAIVGGMVVQANFDELAELAGKRGGSRLGRMALACCLGLLLASLPTNIFWALARSESPRRFGWGETPNVFAHGAAEFLGRKGMPQRVFPVDQGEAAVYIFHNGPGRRVFADGRLEVNTPQTLERYLGIRRQMILQDPDLKASLLEGVPADEAGRRETPALLIDVAAREWNGVATDPNFRLVHFDGVALVFLDVEQAERLGLSALPISDEIIGMARRRASNRRVEND